jgi:hypothetical protein
MLRSCPYPALSLEAASFVDQGRRYFDTQTDSAVKFTYTINERRVYLL